MYGIQICPLRTEGGEIRRKKEGRGKGAAEGNSRLEGNVWKFSTLGFLSFFIT